MKATTNGVLAMKQRNTVILAKISLSEVIVVQNAIVQERVMSISLAMVKLQASSGGTLI